MRKWLFLFLILTLAIWPYTVHAAGETWGEYPNTTGGPWEEIETGTGLEWSNYIDGRGTWVFGRTCSTNFQRWWKHFPLSEIDKAKTISGITIVGEGKGPGGGLNPYKLPKIGLRIATSGHANLEGIDLDVTDVLDTGTNESWSPLTDSKLANVQPNTATYVTLLVDGVGCVGGSAYPEFYVRRVGAVVDFSDGSELSLDGELPGSSGPVSGPLSMTVAAYITRTGGGFWEWMTGLFNGGAKSYQVNLFALTQNGLPPPNNQARPILGGLLRWRIYDADGLELASGEGRTNRLVNDIGQEVGHLVGNVSFSGEAAYLVYTMTCDGSCGESLDPGDPGTLDGHSFRGVIQWVEPPSSPAEGGQYVSSFSTYTNSEEPSAPTANDYINVPTQTSAPPIDNSPQGMTFDKIMDTFSALITISGGFIVLIKSAIIGFAKLVVWVVSWISIPASPDLLTQHPNWGNAVETIAWFDSRVIFNGLTVRMVRDWSLGIVSAIGIYKGMIKLKG